MTPNDFISKKENDTGLLFEKWSLTQLCTYMEEYAKLVSSSNVIPDVSQQRELLNAYSGFLKSDESKYYSDEFGIEEFLEAFNCG